MNCMEMEWGGVTKIAWSDVLHNTQIFSKKKTSVVQGAVWSGLGSHWAQSMVNPRLDPLARL